MNPLDEYLEKRAARQLFLPGIISPLSRMASRLGPAAEQAGVQAGVGLGIAGIGAGAIGIYRAITKRRDFRGMLESNPDLQEFHQADPVTFNRHYDSLRALNPRYSSDPVVAGTYMRQMSLNPQSAGKVIVESLESAGKGSLKPSIGVKWQTGEKPSSALELKAGY